MKYSEQLSDFLTFLREVQSEYSVAYAAAGDADKETQDLLHSIELGENKYHDLAKLSIALKEVRQERRKAKDVVEATTPIINWITQNQKVINELSKLLGEVRKAEERLSNRSYTPRTDIIETTLKKETKTKYENCENI